jgi:hypothetical protein
MPETAGRVIRRRAVLAACLVLSFALSAAAQQPDQPVASPAPDQPDFLTRADFQLSASRLAGIDDIRFSWDTHFGGSLDVVDYVAGRVGIYVDYQAVLGDEFRIFDPNQGNYTLEANASGRVNDSTEIVGIFHHVSRHLSDRPKRFAIAWNLLGARVLHHAEVGSGTIDIDLEGGRIVQHSFVDYAWIGELHVQGRRPLNKRVTVYGRAAGQWVGVNDEVPGRERQAGGFVEAGLRLKGTAGVMELFAGVERRVDADALDRLPQRWGLAGFRLLSR